MASSDSSRLDRLCHRFGPWVLLTLIAGAYAGSLGVPFIFDDEFAIVRNQSIRDLGNWPGVLMPDAATAGAAGRPVVNLSFAVNYALHGLNPVGYHVGNVLTHLGVTLVFGALLRRVFRLSPGLVKESQAEPLALSLAALWCVHPLLTISVTVVQQRTELFAALFILLTLYCQLRAHQSAGRRRLWLGLGVGSCALAMGSKEVAIGLPVLALFFDRAFLAGSFPKALRESWFYYLMLFATWFVLWWSMSTSGQRNNTAGLGLGVSSWHYLLTQCDALVLYARLCVWPAPLIYDYGTPIIEDWREVWWQGVLVIGALIGAFYALVRRPRLGFAAALVFAVLAPSSSFVPVITQTMGEQRMYLPSAAIVTILGFAAYRLLKARTPLLLALLAVSAATASHLRVRDYATEETIWKDVTVKLPGGPRGYANLLYVLIKHGRDEEAVRALPEFVHRLGQNHQGSEPFVADEHTAQLMALMGSAYVDVKKIDVALDFYRRAAVLAPKNQLAHFNSAKLLFDLKRHQEAMPYLETFLGFRPGDTEALQMFGRCLMLTEQFAQAEKILGQLVKLSPRNLEAALDYADTIILQERYQEGAQLYRDLQRIAPKNPRVTERLSQLSPLISPSFIP